MGKIKNARVFQHEHKVRVLAMKLERLENSGVRGDNTEHKGLG